MIRRGPATLDAVLRHDMERGDLRTLADLDATVALAAATRTLAPAERAGVARVRVELAKRKGAWG